MKEYENWASRISWDPSQQQQQKIFKWKKIIVSFKLINVHLPKFIFTFNLTYFLLKSMCSFYVAKFEFLFILMLFYLESPKATHDFSVKKFSLKLIKMNNFHKFFLFTKCFRISFTRISNASEKKVNR